MAMASSSLDDARDDYERNVVDGGRYANILGSIKYSFYNDDDNGTLEEIEDMNRYWNAFRNAAYDEYYEDDYVLKADIDYDAYAEDERLLRLYTDTYYEFFEYLANDFVMTYEYANNTAIDMYTQIEGELQVLGRPVAKLNLLVELYNILQMQGGTAAVLEAIYVKDANEESAAVPEESGLVVLDASTKVRVHDNLTGEERDYNLVETVEHDILGGTDSTAVYDGSYGGEIAAELAPDSEYDDIDDEEGYEEYAEEEAEEDEDGAIVESGEIGEEGELAEDDEVGEEGGIAEFDDVGEEDEEGEVAEEELGDEPVDEEEYLEVSYQ
jgi:hypothetical protein